ncbi:MAG: flagellar basal body rod protein FlgB [Anaerolineales bacterium]|nr:flagellar basal body rod protein FlgB [Anaerolineales bacterium]
MSDPILADPALTMAKRALDGLALRQELIGRNIANVDTPGYRAVDVNFEEALLQVQAHIDALDVARTDSDHLMPAENSPTFRSTFREGGNERADGNNVEIEQELMQMTETGVRYQAISQLISDKLVLLKSIASGG